ncbi:DUF5715 family protein [Roseisolibacter agri]|uniref:Secreted protein n=1 Tax=Roseisolibacter agri TaxID=2014610 RepID=A0AA37QAA3_9BACT|nr:DUF5715 family protein [Roseisolibacter agri]GLC25981.1 hypothetical protein rosag_24940 [Roseisolibacter agri]
MTRTRRAGPALLLALALALALAPAVASANPTALGGSMASMVRQHRVAESEGLAFSRTEARVDRLVADGALEPVPGNADYIVLESVGHKVARPEVRLLVERLAAQYRAATGDPLVVTSLVRPLDEQPANAHRLSVHPAGIAMDLRVPANAESRRWLERTLLALERAGVLDVTREQRPPHYHVAVFPAAYRAYVAKLDAAKPAPAPARAEPEVHAPVTVAAVAPATVVAPATPEARFPASTGLGGALAAVLAAVLAGAMVVIVRWRGTRTSPVAGGGASPLGSLGGA